MGQARLKNLALKGFRSFADRSTLDFPDSGMILFRGHNLETGGSSGSGKSSLLLAITYLLGFCRFPGTSLQSWLTEEPTEVTGTFQVDDGELVVSRGQRLMLTLNGKKLTGGAKQLEEQLSRLVGLPPELLAALTYRGQKQPGLFLSKTDSEKKEFLTTLLDLGKFEAAIENSQVKAKALEIELKGQQYVLDGLKRDAATIQAVAPAALKDEAAMRQELALAQGNEARLRNQVLDLRLKVRSAEAEIEAEAARIRQRNQAQIDDAQARLDALRETVPDESSIDRSKLERLQADQAAAEGFLKDELEADQVRSRVQRKQADSVYAQLLLLEKRLAQKPVIERRLEQLRKEIVQLAASLCPTCNRTWADALAKKTELEAETLKLAAEHQEISGLGPQVSSLQAEYQKLGQFEPSPAAGELRSIVAQLTQDVAVEKQNIAGQVAGLRSTLNARITEIEGQLRQVKLDIGGQIEVYRSTARENIYTDQEVLETLERDQAVAEAQVRGIQAALSRVQIDNAREQEREAQARKRQQDLLEGLGRAQKLSDDKQALLNAELDFQRLVGREGFLGSIFDEVLSEISDETNRLLGQFPNTSHVTLNFRSETSTQKGAVKKSITPVVTVGGYEAPLAAGLSGGMETAVELAVDLAVATVVSRRTGSMPGWIILDESFTGLGPVEAEASMEILRAFAETKLVLVVDHASEFKSLFTQFVDVKYEGGKSRVE